MGKLSKEQINKIKTIYKTGNYTKTELAKKFNVSISLISRYTTSFGQLLHNYNNKQLYWKNHI